MMAAADFRHVVRVPNEEFTSRDIQESSFCVRASDDGMFHQNDSVVLWDDLNSRKVQKISVQVIPNKEQHPPRGWKTRKFLQVI